MAEQQTHEEMLANLPHIEKELKPIEQLGSQVNIAGSILLLARINHETEFKACYAAAEHLFNTHFSLTFLVKSHNVSVFSNFF